MGNRDTRLNLGTLGPDSRPSEAPGSASIRHSTLDTRRSTATLSRDPMSNVECRVSNRAEAANSLRPETQVEAAKVQTLLLFGVLDGLVNLLRPVFDALLGVCFRSE